MITLFKLAQYPLAIVLQRGGVTFVKAGSGLIEGYETGN